MTQLTIRADRHYIRAGYRSNRFLLASLTAPDAPRREQRAPVTLAFVLDRSGSMGGRKLELAKVAVEAAIGRLRPEDHFAIVAYDDVVEVVAESTAATDEARRTAIDRLARIEARSRTNLSDGWLRGCEQVATALARDGVNRCLLLTDGLANLGITDPAELERQAGELRQRGISTTTFGVGDDFDEFLLGAMAVAGGGHFYFIADEQQIPTFIADEVGETLEVVAHDVALEIVVPPAVDVEALTPLPLVRGTETASIALGDLVSRQQVELVVRLNFPLGGIGSGVPVGIHLRARDGVPGSDHRVEFEYADDRTNDIQPRDQGVDRAVARTFAARVRQEAAELNRSGRFVEAQDRLRRVSRRIQSYAGNDPEMTRIVASLNAEEQIWAAPMAPADRKTRYFAASAMLASRDVSGRAQRG
jgi:hypothetical protein